MPESIPNKPLTKREEKALVDAGRRVLLDGGFPNPERVGCPGPEVLKAIAFRKMKLAQADNYIDHLGSCSPCFVDYSAFREQVVRSARLRVMAIAAGVLMIIGAGTWLWVNSRHRKGPENIATHNQPPAITYEGVTLDLTNRSVVRGEEGTPKALPPLEVQRGRLAVTIYLPFGSEEGKYQVRILQRGRPPVGTAEGVAQIRNGVTTLEIKLDTTTIAPGTYSFGVRQRGHYWSFYPVLVK